MRAGTGRAAAGTAVAVAAALVLFLVLRGTGGQPAAATTASASPPGGQAAELSGGRNQTGTPSAAATGPHANPLAAAAAYAAGRAGSVLAAVYDVRTGQTWRLGTGQPQAEASVVKLDILETLLAREDGGALRPGDQALAQSMIEDSDNDAATSLWDEAGGAAGLSAYDDQAGLTSTIPSPCVDCAGFAWPGWGLTTTMPDDQLTLLKQLIVPGQRPLLSDAARSYALSLMENVAPEQRWGVSGGVPAGATVALKNGWLPLDAANTDWQVNSVGWVSGEGRDYLIAVLSTGSPSEQYGIDTINGLSALVWSGLG
jgi:beta-lactamase class A